MKTLKPLKRHKAGTKRSQLHKMTLKTLGSGNLSEAVILPKGERINEWLAMNTIDFFNEMCLLYGVIVDSAIARFTKPGEGFPAGFEYRWTDSAHKQPFRCSAAE